MLKFCCYISYQDEVDIKSISAEDVENSSSKDRCSSDEMHFTSSHHSLLSSKLLLLLSSLSTICLPKMGGRYFQFPGASTIDYGQLAPS